MSVLFPSQSSFEHLQKRVDQSPCPLLLSCHCSNFPSRQYAHTAAFWRLSSSSCECRICLPDTLSSQESVSSSESWSVSLSSKSAFFNSYATVIWTSTQQSKLSTTGTTNSWWFLRFTILYCIQIFWYRRCFFPFKHPLPWLHVAYGFLLELLPIVRKHSDSALSWGQHLNVLS